MSHSVQSCNKVALPTYAGVFDTNQQAAELPQMIATLMSDVSIQPGYQQSPQQDKVTRLLVICSLPSMLQLRPVWLWNILPIKILPTMTCSLDHPFRQPSEAQLHAKQCCQHVNLHINCDSKLNKRIACVGCTC